MPLKTNLNISPYFDDFDPIRLYNKILFKPGYPVQARELTTLQSIVQHQIEQFGTHFFKEGSVVIPGSLSYRDDINAVLLDLEFNGVNVEGILPFIVKQTIRGRTSGVRARIERFLTTTSSERNQTTIYVNYISSDTQENNRTGFLDGEILELENPAIISDNIPEVGDVRIVLQAGEAFASTVSQGCNAISSGVYLTQGVFFLRGHFVDVPGSYIHLDQYSNTPSYRVGLRVYERIVTPADDVGLNDNARGFTNYAAPGADRLQIYADLDKVPLNATPEDLDNFIELTTIRDGIQISVKNNTEYNIIAEEFARRTFDESGDYYLKAPSIDVKETLNDLKGNNGLFLESGQTYNNNAVSESLGSYIVSPLKAYVKGYAVESIAPTFLDFEKTRTTRDLKGQLVTYNTGPTYTVNRVYGAPLLGLTTSYTLSLRNNRVGVNSITAPGKEIGVARVYDFALESGSYSFANQGINQWDLALYDIQTYTEISLNEDLDDDLTYNIPCRIKGKSSGAIGYLRFDGRNSGIITAYNIKGSFSIGERIEFNGVENTRISTAVTSYSKSDVKSLYGVVGTAYTFTADVLQTTKVSAGSVSISPLSAGISTATAASFSFPGNAKVDDVVAFSSPGFEVPTFARVTAVTQNTLTLVGVATVPGVCNGGLPDTTLNVSDFRILTTELQNSIDNTLYTRLPKSKVASVDVTNSTLTIKRQFDVQISANQTEVELDIESNETFLPYDEERYTLVRKDGATEILTQDKFVFLNGGKLLRILGLGGDSEAKLIATLTKSNIKTKIKNRNKVKSIIVSKSSNASSGVGNTSLDDGLTYGNYPYGTRVQDDEICLLEPEVTKIHAIFESSTTLDPVPPGLILSNLTGENSTTIDLLIGEEFYGQSSQAVGVYVERISDSRIQYININSNSFVDGETIVFKDSLVRARITSRLLGDKDITNNFTLDNGQYGTIVDYSRITRKVNYKSPSKKIRIYFESTSSVLTDGDIVNVNSYNQLDYCDLPKVNNISVSDIIDLRPVVSNYNVGEGSRSPFEFLARDFSTGATSSNILASDEGITIDYSFYLPRIDKITITNTGIFQVINGIPSENPVPPSSIDNALEIASVYLPPYLCDIKEASITIQDHRRYRMSDIRQLEERIKNLEYYTTLSLLEVDTSGLLIRDVNGLDRFKSGFYVDNFADTKSQKKVTTIKNSIDPANSELRPSPYVTSVDLILGKENVDPSEDYAFSQNILGSNIRKTGQVITLDYDEVLELEQTFATRIENVNPYNVSFYGGTIELFPSSDVWIDEVRLDANVVNAEGNYTETLIQLQAEGFDPQTGFGQVVWGSWEDVWTGTDVAKSSRQVTRGYDIIREDLETTTRTGTSTRYGTRKALTEEFSYNSLGDETVNTEVVANIRSRNVQFTARRFRPLTRVYSFFDGVDVMNYIIPKLLEVKMNFGLFEVGETVEGSFNDPTITNPKIYFRLATQNHKYGPYNAPTDVFFEDPYTNERLFGSYFLTSTILNVDTYSLSNQPQSTFYGNISVGMKLKGLTSGAEAEVTNLRLVTDAIGDVIGSFFIPDPNTSGLKFQAGTRVFRLTSSETNSQIGGQTITSAEEKYYSEGRINTVRENAISLRNARVEVDNSPVETKALSETGSPVVVGSTVIGRVPPPPPPPPPPPSYWSPPAPPSSGGGGGCPPRSSGPYQGIACGYIYATGTYGTVNQNQSYGDTGIGQVVTTGRAQIGVGGIERALAQGYPAGEVAQWIHQSVCGGTGPGCGISQEVKNLMKANGVGWKMFQ